MRATRVLVTMTLAATGLLPVGAAQAGPVVMCRGEVATIVGTAGPDTLTGTSHRDVIAGLGGADRVNGLAGNDVICGGRGSDDLDGGRGADRLFGGADRAYEGFSSGGAEFTVGVGDLLAGGPGDDRLDAGYDPRPDFWEPHSDRLVFHGRHGVELRLAALGDSGSAVGEGRDVVVGQPHLAVKGSPGPDDIWGSPYADIIDGAAGDDVIRGREGDDVITDGGKRDAPDRDVLGGGSGIDVLTARFGADVVDGGPGADTLRGSSIQMVALRGGFGRDLMSYGSVGRGCPVIDGGPGRDRLGLKADDSVDGDSVRITLDGSLAGCGAVRSVANLLLAPGDLERWEVVGTNRGEVVTAIRSARLYASMRGGNDLVVGGRRDDVLIGGPGDDKVDGSEGTDTCKGFETKVSCERP